VGPVVIAVNNSCNSNPVSFGQKRSSNSKLMGSPRFTNWKLGSSGVPLNIIDLILWRRLIFQLAPGIAKLAERSSKKRHKDSIAFGNIFS